MEIYSVESRKGGVGKTTIALNLAKALARRRYDGETVVDETQFIEVARVRVCPREKLYGIQVPKGAWHSIEVYEPSTIFEAKDGKYGE